MKKVIPILILFLVMFSFVAAEIEIHNYTINSVSSSNEVISGSVELTITDHPYFTYITSSSNENISLGEFLNDHDADYTCSPGDCDFGYVSVGSDISGDSFPISTLTKEILGFPLSGPNVHVNSIYFEIDSDFSESNIEPLNIELCGEEVWYFDKFSESYRDKDWGCYNKGYIDEEDPYNIGPGAYCELIYIPRSDTIKMGAKIKFPDTSNGELAETRELKMELCQNDRDSCAWDCSYFPDNETDGCVEDAGTEEGYFEEGNYWVCVSANVITRYRIFTESSGSMCGFFRDSDAQESSIDFGIYIQANKYADYTLLEESFVPEWIDYTKIANDFLKQKYNNDCTNDCVLPLSLFGISQNFVIKNISLDYITDGRNRKLEKIMLVDEVEPIVNFNGTLDLSLLNFFVDKSGTYNINIGEEELLKNFNITVAPKIISVNPLVVPGGIPMDFYVEVDFEGSESLTYIWDFGDGTNVTTFDPKVTHIYEELRAYGLRVRVRANSELEDYESFDIDVITPEEAIKSSLSYKINSINVVKSVIEDASASYKTQLYSMTDLDMTLDKLKALNNTFQDATSDEEFISIAAELYALDVPIEVIVSDFSKPYLINEISDVFIKPILDATGEFSSASDRDYADSILNWQNNNIQAVLTNKVYNINFFNGATKSLNVYDFDVVSYSSEKSYFVLDIPLADLTFSGSVEVMASGSSTVVFVSPNYDGNIEFFTSEMEDFSYFFSPALSSMVIESDIDITCNYNKVCEESNGENFGNCRSDCLPIKKIVSYSILLLFGFLFLYFLLQLWYNKRYEKYLFNDSRQLYNLLMFVANARTRDMKESQIASNLRKQGWSNERVNFIMKKSLGKRTGLPELIPISKISAKFRNMKAKIQQSEEAKAQVDNSVKGPNNLPPPLSGSGGVPPRGPRRY